MRFSSATAVRNSSAANFIGTFGLRWTRCTMCRCSACRTAVLSSADTKMAAVSSCVRSTSLCISSDSMCLLMTRRFCVTSSSVRPCLRAALIAAIRCSSVAFTAAACRSPGCARAKFAIARPATSTMAAYGVRGAPSTLTLFFFVSTPAASPSSRAASSVTAAMSSLSAPSTTVSLTFASFMTATAASHDGSESENATACMREAAPTFSLIAPTSCENALATCPKRSQRHFAATLASWTDLPESTTRPMHVMMPFVLSLIAGGWFTSSYLGQKHASASNWRPSCAVVPGVGLRRITSASFTVQSTMLAACGTMSDGAKRPRAMSARVAAT